MVQIVILQTNSSSAPQVPVFLQKPAAWEMHVVYLNYKHTAAQKLLQQHPEETASPLKLHCNEASKLGLQPTIGLCVWDQIGFEDQ